MVKSSIAFLLTLFLTASAQVSRVYPDVTVLASDDRGITVEYRPQFGTDETVSDEGSVYTRPTVLRTVRVNEGKGGTEDLLARVITLAVPGRTGHSLTVLSADYETLRGFDLAPVASVVPADGAGAVKRNYRPAFDRSGTPRPASVAELGPAASVKGWLTAHLSLAPYRYNAAAKELHRYSRIVVRVEFGPRTASFDRSGNDAWAAAGVVNYGTALRWSGPALRRTAASSSVRSSGTWFRFEVSEEGMYRIDASYLSALGIAAASLSSITDVKVFGSDGRPLAENVWSPRAADLTQLAVRYVDHDGDGKFDADDHILFYAQNASGWNYDPVQKEFQHYINPYSTRNVYFIAVGANAPAAVMAEASYPLPSAPGVTAALGKAYFKEEKVNFNYSGLNWVSAPFSDNDSRVIGTRLSGQIPGTSVRYHYHLYARSLVSSTFRLDESGVQIGNAVVPRLEDWEYNSASGNYAANLQQSVTAVPSLTDERSMLKFTYTSGSPVSVGYIDWVRYFYRQRLAAVNGQLSFTGPDTGGVVRYDLSGFPSNDITVYDVTDHRRQRRLAASLGQVMGTVSFADSAAAGAVRRYWAGTPAAYRTPGTAVKIGTSDLHGAAGADFVIVTHAEFLSEAQRLRVHKESLPKPLRTMVVSVDSIFNEFGAGHPDPASIRDFLRHAYDQWSVRPKYVLFFGDATFDHKNILGDDPWWVPTKQTTESNSKISTFNFEDYFAYLDPNAPYTVSLAHGRLCPRSAAEAKVLVDRIIAYETTPDRGDWKNLITVVADDLWSTDSQNEVFNTNDSETLTSLIPRSYEVRRLYTEDYPLTFASSGRRRPEARADLLSQVNRGTLILNYAGHGNPKVWAHEAILTLEDVKTQFTNADRLTFIVAATCDWGRFDEGTAQSSAEEVMVNRNGGAIGVLSATRAVYAHENAALNQSFYTHLFGGTPMMTLGDALMLTKNQVSSGLENKQKYFLLGDPTLTLAAPSGRLTVDSINHRSAALQDTLSALEKVVVSASVRDTAGAVVTAFQGTALVTVFDSERNRTITTIPSVPFVQQGAVIYKGEASIVDGRMSASFIVPKDISYENKKGRLSVYFSNAAADGTGYSTNFIVGGTNDDAPADSLGPVIRIYLDSPSFRSGDLVGDSPVLIADLTDSSGINSSGSAIGHRIEAWIDGAPKSVDLTPYYKGKTDSYQSGAAEYPLSGLSPGSHTVKVRAWDAYNNSNTAEAVFTVASSDGLAIHNVYNFPNPVRTSTVFTFQHNQLAPVDITIALYTVAGRLVHRIERFAVTDRFVRIPWDRRDSDGDEVGNGIYLYKVTARTADGRFTSEALGRMAVVR